MQTYVCHKEVSAAKILNIVSLDPLSADGTIVLNFGGDAVPVYIDLEWFLKHSPRPDGYFVEYEDGYTSYSPADAFEKGYTLK